MAASLPIERYIALVAESAARMIRTIEDVGFQADVVTCPAWDGRALIAHQAMVHRWAAAHLRGEDADGLPSQTAIRETVADLGSYFREGLDQLLDAMRSAPPDLVAMVFLLDAPAPRTFWARRQTHETTIHMVDALSAGVGRVPSAAEVGVEHDVALDGIDELLCGFFTRGRSKLFDGTDYDVTVAPSDSPRRWKLHVAERMTASTGDAGSVGDPDDRDDVRITGTAAQIYLALWNRGDEIEIAGDDTLLDRWRRSQRVRWS
jgi:uncharacterized protein (TIGR03083 family)